MVRCFRQAGMSHTYLSDPDKQHGTLNAEHGTRNAERQTRNAPVCADGISTLFAINNFKLTLYTNYYTVFVNNSTYKQVLFCIFVRHLKDPYLILLKAYQ